MTSFFPDVNVWLALTVERHPHSSVAWDWLNSVDRSARVLFSRYTQLGFLRLLSNPIVTGKDWPSLAEASTVYREYLRDPRIEFHQESRATEAALWEALEAHESQSASKFVGDAYLLAFARAQGAVLVTFDKALYKFALANDYAAIIPR